VLDASIAMAWCFEDETNELTEAILSRLARDTAVVPSLWRFEVANVLAVGQRRGRLTEAQAARFVALLRRLPISLDETAPDATALLAVAHRHELSAYDAAYLELAQRRGVGVATQDARLRSATLESGLPVMIG
jgi:predicted nucleic acid-binding protein